MWRSPSLQNFFVCEDLLGATTVYRFLQHFRWHKKICLKIKRRDLEPLLKYITQGYDWDLRAWLIFQSSKLPSSSDSCNLLMPPFYIISLAVVTCIICNWNPLFVFEQTNYAILYISTEQTFNKLRMVIFRPEPSSGQHNADNRHIDNDQLNFEIPVLPNKEREKNFQILSRMFI